MAHVLASNQYGKTNVRVLRVIRGQDQHDSVLEMRVQVQLHGEFERSYTHGDNRQVIPTDTVKNTIYAMAKESDCSSIEAYAMHTARHFLNMYGHVVGCDVDVEQVNWLRIPISGQPHKHSWTQERDLRTTHVSARPRSDGSKRDPVFKIESGIKNLTVLKTHGSGWVDYHECKFTTLKPAVDRLLSTDILCTWVFNAINADFNAVYSQNKAKLLELFATEYSPGVQKTVWDVGCAMLDAQPSIDSVYMKLPNKHYWHYDIERFGYANSDEVYAPQTDPSGLIDGRVSRASAKL